MAAPQWWKLLEWNLCVAVNKQLFSESFYDTYCGLSSGTNEVGHEREWVIIGKLMSIMHNHIVIVIINVIFVTVAFHIIITIAILIIMNEW